MLVFTIPADVGNAVQEWGNPGGEALLSPP